VAFDTNRSQLRLVTDAREMISVDRRASIGLAPAELSRDLESTGAVSVSTDGTLIGVNGYTPRWFSSGAGIPRADDLSLPGNPFGYRLSLGRDYLIAQGSFGFGDYAIARAGGTRTAIDFDVGPDQGLPTAAGGADVLVVVRNQAIHSYSTARLVAGDLAEISAPIPVGADVTGLTISDDGRRVALVADDEARIYDRESGQLLLTAASPDLAVSPSVTIDPSGSLLAVSSQRSISVWDVATRQVVLDATHERELGQVDISADGLLVAADGGRAVWELTSGRRISGVSVEIDSAVGVGFLGATHRLVSVGSRRGQSELMIWDTLDPDAACRLAAPSMQGRSVAPYLRPGRAPSAC
jgi:WD40 repeat protein